MSLSVLTRLGRSCKFEDIFGHLQKRHLRQRYKRHLKRPWKSQNLTRILAVDGPGLIPQRETNVPVAVVVVAVVVVAVVAVFPLIVVS